jgi:signal transduction histidine kinase
MGEARADEAATAGQAAFELLPPGHRTPLPPPRRADPDRLQREIARVSRSPIVTAVLETADAILLVLNVERQIVAFNSRVREVAAPGDVRGLRPGEALGCVNSAGPDGCGSAPACATCGALGAVVGCQTRRLPVMAECSLRSEADGGRTLEFNARATPVTIEGSVFTVLSLRDISAERRRQVLEQVFFHDVLNTVSGLLSWSLLLRRASTDPRRAAERIDVLSRQVEREIKHHRSLSLAESGTLEPEWATVDAARALQDLSAVFSEHPSASERRLEVGAAPPGLAVRSDASLVLRILVNAVRNALEASPPGGVAQVWCEGADGGVRFLVRNAGVMPDEAQARVFQRSFSTKAPTGRGLGTYGMKLFGERYLGGKVSFVSSAREGTVFTVWLPGPLVTPAAGG